VTTVGLIANPLAGKDVRRFVSAASLNSDRSKIEILRRCVLGAIDAGAEKVLLANDFRNLTLRAVDGLDLGSKIEEISFHPEGRRTDTTEAAKIFKKEGVKSVISLGGDGTQRDLVLGWMDAPLLPISTGTNNVFPFMVDPTVAGTAAGLIASDELSIEEVSKQAKVIHVQLPNGIKDLALVDVVLVDDRLTGSRVVVKPDSVKQVLAAIANPASIGLASIAGRSNPVYFDDELAVSVICDPTAKQGVFAPIMPGSVSDVGIVDIKEVELGETIELDGPGALAFDGERDFVIRENEVARATVLRNGPKVINPIFAIQTAAANKVFLRKRNS
jgi:predicted polyphosphate/ATP-dependent NAD kinase